MVLRETIYYVPSDARMEGGKPVGISKKCDSLSSASVPHSQRLVSFDIPLSTCAVSKGWAGFAAFTLAL